MCSSNAFKFRWRWSGLVTVSFSLLRAEPQKGLDEHIDNEGGGLAWEARGEHVLRSKQNPNPKDNSLIKKDTSAYKGFRSTFAALFSY